MPFSVQHVTQVCFAIIILWAQKIEVNQQWEGIALQILVKS
jgi:hypothetical protein